MSNFWNRVSSFRTWPASAVVSEVQLADCGLYFTGSFDEVICYECKVKIKNWQIHDVPRIRHHSVSPNCKFILGESSTTTSYISSRETKATESVKGRIRIESAEQALEAMEKIEGNQWFLERKPFNPNSCRSRVDYKIASNRLSSFEGYRSDVFPILPSELAEAGLYYIGPKDRVQCPFCRGKLINWEQGDKPFLEHLKHFPLCSFVQEKLKIRANTAEDGMIAARSHPAVLTVKKLGFDEDIVYQALSNLCREPPCKITGERLLDAVFEIEKKSSHKNSNLTSLRTSIGDDKESKGAEAYPLNEETGQNTERLMCNICLEREKNTVFLTCRHLVCCSICSESLDSCPVCRSRIIATLQAYL